MSGIVWSFTADDALSGPLLACCCRHIHNLVPVSTRAVRIDALLYFNVIRHVATDGRTDGRARRDKSDSVGLSIWKMNLGRLWGNCRRQHTVVTGVIAVVVVVSGRVANANATATGEQQALID